MTPIIAGPQLGVVELRQYSLHKGMFDSIVDLFEREFIETQEATGMRVIGQFRDLDDADRFVWLRGFPDMDSRQRSLQLFYDGPVWAAHREAANAHFVDTDDVLLLRPVDAYPGFDPGPASRGAPGRDSANDGLIAATIYSLDEPGAEFAEFFTQAVRPELRAAGMSILAELQTETAANNFPRLPVREGENVFVWFSTFAQASDYAHCYARLRESKRWRDTLAPALRRRLRATPQLLRLRPTARSRLRA